MMAARSLLGVAVLAALAGGSGCRVQDMNGPAPVPPPPPPAAAAGIPCERLYTATAEEDQFLDDLERRIVLYFWNEVFPETGIAIDHTENRVGKVAATGFELPAICIGVKRGWIPYEEGYQRALKILHAFWDDPDDPSDAFVDGQFGLWWHFVDGKTGRMMPIDCVAMCDSADLVAGIVVAGQFFRGTEVETLAGKIYDAVEWNRFVTKKPDGTPGLMSFGWVPLHVSESYYDTDGLLSFNMAGLADNSLLIYALALGSDTHPIPQETWETYVDTYTLDEYAGFRCVRAGQLFCRQVPQSFIRFSRKRDRKMDYFEDTVYALLADRAFNRKENEYPPEAWGLTDCFGKDTYGHAAPPGPVMNDGTIGCTAFAGALPHVPQLSFAAMKFAREKYGDRIYGEYGFTSTYNLKNDFVSPLYVGIELGPMINLIENFRSGMVWDLMMAAPCMSNFVRRAGMCGVVDDFELPPEAAPYAAWTAEGAQAAVSTDRPQHGKYCLRLKPEGRMVRLAGRLTANDLLQFHFGKYLSVWTADAEIRQCSVSLDGRDVVLAPAGRIDGTPWSHSYFEMPPCLATSAICSVVLELTAGSDAAVDNITLEAAANRAPPAVITDLAARTGKVGGAVVLRWTVPADPDGDRVTRYVVRVNDGREIRELDLAALEPAGAPQESTLLLDGGRKYAFKIAAVDGQGHMAAFSESVDGRASSEPLQRRAYDFEDGQVGNWKCWGSNWTMTVVGEAGSKCLRVQYHKDNPWNNLEAPLNGDMVALHRYITVKVKGKVEILGKIWCSEQKQEDMHTQKSESDSEWTVFKYDTWAANMSAQERAQVKKLFLFPEPGRVGRQGVFYIDDVEYSN